MVTKEIRAVEAVNDKLDTASRAKSSVNLTYMWVDPPGGDRSVTVLKTTGNFQMVLGDPPKKVTTHRLRTIALGS